MRWVIGAALIWQAVGSLEQLRNIRVLGTLAEELGAWTRLALALAGRAGLLFGWGI